VGLKKISPIAAIVPMTARKAMNPHTKNRPGCLHPYSLVSLHLLSQVAIILTDIDNPISANLDINLAGEGSVKSSVVSWSSFIILVVVNR
jgi:hypothetical protein